MSRIGRKPLPLPKGVTLGQKPGMFSVKGPKGELSKLLPPGVTFKTEADKTTRARTAPNTGSFARISPTWSKV
jgi:large subunit ribosomal protein L6